MNSYFVFGKKLTATSDSELHNSTILKLWNSFCFFGSELDLKKGEEASFTVGTCKVPILKEGKEFVFTVTESGIAVRGKDYGGLVRGLIVLMMKIQQIGFEEGNEQFRIPCGTVESNYKIANRMIHICVFPESDFYYIKKVIRLIGICQYTHLVLEFWGMLRFDCMKELSWPQAWSKEQVREIIEEIRNLGMEPIPMYNQFGHATACRVVSGKHVVLDQNPHLHGLFTPDGWAWNIESEAVLSLFRKVRGELYDLFGSGDYIHMGFDEADYYSSCDALRKKLPLFFEAITNEVVKEGRRPMIWMDMLLEENRFQDCFSTGKKGETSALLAAMAKETVFVDWQYKAFKCPIPSTEYLKQNYPERDIMGAPWYKKENYIAHIETIQKERLFGIMVTTWHRLNDYMGCILGCAKECGSMFFDWAAFGNEWTLTATILRHVSFEGNSYQSSGWVQNQI